MAIAWPRSGGTGVKIDAGGGAVAFEGAHINSGMLGLDIHGASSVSLINTLFLNMEP